MTHISHGVGIRKHFPVGMGSVVMEWRKVLQTLCDARATIALRRTGSSVRRWATIRSEDRVVNVIGIRTRRRIVLWDHCRGVAVDLLLVPLTSIISMVIVPVILD